MPWAAVGAIGGALIASDASSQAASAAGSQNQQNIAAQMGWNQLVDPFTAGGNRAQYVSQLNNLMQGGYQGIQNDPMYQWMRQQGVDQMQRGNSASGQGASGNEMIALQNQGFGLAQDFFNQQYSRLADLSGASRGGGQAAIGMSPTQVFNMGNDRGQTNANAFMAGIGGIQSIYGSMNSSYNHPTNIYSGAYNPNSYGTYDPNPNGTNP